MLISSSFGFSIQDLPAYLQYSIVFSEHKLLLLSRS